MSLIAPRQISAGSWRVSDPAIDRSELLNAIADLVGFAVRTGVEVERERCAKIAESAFLYYPDDPTLNEAVCAGQTIAQLIRDQTTE